MVLKIDLIKKNINTIIPSLVKIETKANFPATVSSDDIISLLCIFQKRKQKLKYRDKHCWLDDEFFHGLN